MKVQVRLKAGNPAFFSCSGPCFLPDQVSAALIKQEKTKWKGNPLNDSMFTRVHLLVASRCRLNLIETFWQTMNAAFLDASGH